MLIPGKLCRDADHHTTILAVEPDLAYWGGLGVRIPTKSPGYNGIMPPGIPE